MAKTTNITFGSGNTNDAQGKPVKLAYTPMTEKEKHEHMKRVVKNLHDTNYQTSGITGSSTKIGPVNLK